MTRKASRYLALSAAVALGLTACSGAKEDQQAGGGEDAKCPITADETFTGTLRINYQHIPNGDLIVKDKGWLEACLPKGKVEWIKADSGGSVVKNFASKQVDLGLIGSSPATKSLSPDLNKEASIRIIWIHDVIGAAESLAVRDTAVTDIKGLAGKKIAVPFASTAHYSLLAALDRAGMATGPDAPELINLEPEAVIGGWEKGDIDAAWIWEPQLSKLVADGKGKILLTAEQTAKEGAPTYDLAAATDEFVTKNPGAMKVWTGLQNEAVKVIRSDETAASEAIAAQLGVSGEEAKTLMKGLGYLDATEQAGEKYLGGGLGTDMLNTAKFLEGQGEIAGLAPEGDYAKALYADAAKEIAG